MIETIVLVGDSPLSLFIAQKLDQEFARRVNTEVLWLTRDFNCVLKDPIGSPGSFVSKKTFCPHIKIVTDPIRSIRLADREILTENKQYGYDQLIIDQTPSFTSEELQLFQNNLRQLTAQIRALKNRGTKGKASITFTGNDPNSWQLALSTRKELVNELGNLSHQVEILCKSKDTIVEKFLLANGVTACNRVSKLPGIVVPNPVAPVLARQIHGLKLTKNGEPIVSISLQIESHPEVIIYPFIEDIPCQLLSVQRTVGQEITGNLTRSLSGKKLLPISLQTNYCLKGIIHSLLRMGRIRSENVRARLVSTLERRIANGLLR